MKKLPILIFAILMIYATVPSQLNATAKTTPINTTITATEPTESEIANTLSARLIEIKALDLSTLTRTEKKELRNEVRSIQSELKAMNYGVYISVGALVLILILLIILL